MATTAAHSHRPTTKVVHKSFKSRKATKGQLRDNAKGRVEHEKGVRRTPHQHVMSKLDRRNQAKQRQSAKRKDHYDETRVFAGRDGAPRVVAVVPLCADSDVPAAIEALNGSLDIETDFQNPASNFRITVDRFKQKLQYVPLERDLGSCMDGARVADFVVVVLSADVEVDQLGELILRSVESQGLSNLYTVVQGLGTIESAKQRQQVLSSLKSYMTHFHPGQDKLFSLDNRQECSNLMRSLCNTTPKGVKWRDDRSWMLVEDVQFGKYEAEPTVLTGVVRGRGLKADRLVQLGDWGTFEIDKITEARLTARNEGPADPEEERRESPGVLDEPGSDRDDLADLAPEEVVMQDEDTGDGLEAPASLKKGVLLDDYHYFSDEEAPETTAPRRIPKGTSAYQSAWYLDDDASDYGSDYEDMVLDTVPEEHARPEDGIEGIAQREPTEAAPSEYPQSEMVMEPNADDDRQQLEAYRANKRGEAEDDMEFPDEIELHPNVLARERLARYRGLKSFRDSVWQEDEDRAHEPEAWRRLLHVSDYKASCSRSTREALVGGVAPGTRVNVYVRGVPLSHRKLYNPRRPVTLFSLLRHENKKTAVNYLINLSSDCPTSIKSKEELIVQCGPRRFVIQPIFSQPGITPNDVHKYCRYLHPGQSAVASFAGPLTWGSVPVLFFKRIRGEGQQAESAENVDGPEESNVGLTLIATGTCLPPSTSRVVAKRVILTGHPYHIHKKVVTVRYMFFNREDVYWFKALPLWTKRGRSGEIRESLGTHGYFKATFDGRINPQDSVGVSLYKRVWPRSAMPLNRPLWDVGTMPEQDEGGMEVDTA